jgi:hypothetical protein
MINVSNPGFEDLVLSGPGGAGNFVLDNIPSWVITSVPSQTATFKPGPGQFPGGVPEGVNVAAVGNTTVGIISQTLSATLAANTTYTDGRCGKATRFPVLHVPHRIDGQRCDLGLGFVAEPYPGDLPHGHHHI